MASQTSLATEATRDRAVQIGADTSGGIGAHMSGDWWEHNETNVVNSVWAIPASASPVDESHAAHTIASTLQLRLLVTIGSTDYAIVIPAIDSGVFLGNGTWSGSPSATAPEFTVHPQSVSLEEGDQAILEAAATGTPPILYRWNKDGEPITGEDSATLFISSFTESQAGDYTCVATSATGQTTSNIATLSVRTSTGEAVPTRPF